MKLSIRSSAKLQPLVGTYRTGSPYLDVARHLLVVTNGHAMVLLPVSIEEGETSGSVPIKALAALIRKVKLGEKSATLHCAEKAVLREHDGTETIFPRSTEFVKYAEAMPTTDAAMTACINAKLLHDVQNGLGCDYLTLWIPKEPMGAWVAARTDGKEGVGVIMPVRFEEKNGRPNLESVAVK